MHKNATTILHKQGAAPAAIAERLRALLAEREMTKTDLCRESGVSYRAIVNIADGTNAPQPVTAGRLAKALGTSAEYLIEGSGERNVHREEKPTWGSLPAQDHERFGAIGVLSRWSGVPQERILDLIVEEMKKMMQGTEEQKPKPEDRGTRGGLERGAGE